MLGAFYLVYQSEHVSASKKWKFAACFVAGLASAIWADTPEFQEEFIVEGTGPYLVFHTLAHMFIVAMQVIISQVIYKEKAAVEASVQATTTTAATADGGDVAADAAETKKVN